MNFEIINPVSTKELLNTVKKHQKKNFRYAAGCTDLILDLRKNPVNDLTVINLLQVKDPQFTGIKTSSSGLWLGARVTAKEIVVNEKIKNTYPTLHDAAYSLASTQIREVATLGGNLCTASPSGDIACALMSLEAKCEIINYSGKKKTISIKEFFKGPRKTVLGKGDLLYGVFIPSKKAKVSKLFSSFIKVGVRKSMECSVVSLAYHIQTDAEGNIIHTGIAIGASAPTIRFAEKACGLLIGKNIYKISESEIENFASAVLSYASPISDIRATAWYRKEALFNISKGILEDNKHPQV